MHNRRRASDRRTGFDRRRHVHVPEFPPTPGWDEQRAQHLTRFLIWALALLYFNFGEPPRVSQWFSQSAVNICLLVYGLYTASSFWHAHRRLWSPLRWRVSMWVDLTTISFTILADPLVISPPYLVYLVVMLGNGLRYGLRFFAEAVIGGFLCAVLVLGFRLPEYINELSISAVFFVLFFIIVVVYSYSLTARLEVRKQRLEVERNRDELTGLLNRRALFERAARLFEPHGDVCTPVVVLFADLDGFKAVNDTHGHHVGDRVLAEVGAIVSRLVREVDLAARYGGDEFVLVLPGADAGGGTSVAQRLQKALAEWSRHNRIELSLSVGLGLAPAQGNDLKSVIERVDQAMYQGRMMTGRGGIRLVEPALEA